MYRLTGAALLLVSSFLLRRSFLLRAHLRRKTLRALAEGFLLLASSVRLTLMPLPRLLRKTVCAPEAERFFAAVSDGLARGEAMEHAWAAAALSLPLDARERESIAALGSALGGDEASVCASLTHVSETLRESERRLAQHAREEARVTTALCLSGGLFAVIVLV